MPRRNVNRSVATVLGRFTLTALLLIALVPAGEAQIVAGQSQIPGTWQGTSKCVVRSGACHDETNLYRFSEIAARPGRFSGTGSKIVNGREISMGSLDWKYDAESHVLESNSQGGAFRLVVNGDKIEGTLLLPDGTVYRRIHLVKVK